MEAKKRFLSVPDSHYFLFGPRGTGKSTWLRTHTKDALHIDLLRPDVFRQYASHPERLGERVRAERAYTEVIIDEVQKVPAMLDVVHQLIEEKVPQRFVLTGSSSRKLKRSGTNLLAGRAALRAMHPYMAAELGSEFDLGRALEFGMLPLIHESSEPAETLRAYGGLYLKEEVQQEGIVRRLGDFARFLEASTFSHASVWNSAEVSRECQVSRRTVDSYIEVLEDLLLSFRLPVFSKRAKRQLVSHSKFYWFDCGVYRSMRPTGPLDAQSEIGGTALEGLVAQHLRAFIDYRNQDEQLFFWRTSGGLEVDFVVYGPSRFCAIEVKHSTKVHKKDLRGLLAFREDYPEAEVMLLHRGDEPLEIEGVPCLPVEAYLRSLDPKGKEAKR